MNSKKMIEELKILNEIRNNLPELNISNILKEILRRSLNYYENILNLDITRNNLNNEEFKEHGVDTNNDYVDIPLFDSKNKYQEYAKVYDKDIVPIISELSDNLNNIIQDKNILTVVLKSLKEYSIYLEQVNRKKQSNLEIYNELFDNDKTK